MPEQVKIRSGVGSSVDWWADVRHGQTEESPLVRHSRSFELRRPTWMAKASACLLKFVVGGLVMRSGAMLAVEHQVSQSMESNLALIVCAHVSWALGVWLKGNVMGGGSMRGPTDCPAVGLIPF